MTRAILLTIISLCFSLSANADKLTCRLAVMELAPHQANFAKPVSKKPDFEVNTWQDCYKLALAEAKNHEYAYEDYQGGGNLGDYLNGDADEPYFAGWIYTFVNWKTNDSAVGFYYGSKGIVNVYSADSANTGDQRLDDKGKSFLK